MKKLLALFAVLNLLVVAVLASLIFLAETYPYQPGDRLYKVQTLAERGRLHLIPDDTRQAKFAIELAERRLVDLAQVEGEDQIEMVAAAFDQALSESVEHIQSVPDAQQGQLKTQLNAVLVKTGSVVMSFDPGGEDSAVARLQEKIASFHAPDPVAAEIPVKPDGKIPAEAVSFLGQNVEHEMSNSLLAGKHLEIDCMECHETGRFADTGAECTNCHSAIPDDADYDMIYASLPYPDNLYHSDIYPLHFEGECTDCHTFDNWKPFAFDHQDVTECQSCHRNEAPVPMDDPFAISVAYVATSKPGLPDHYPGQCVDCHTDTTAWEKAAYEHSGGAECISCHVPETPSNHYEGDCLSCHPDTETWDVITFDHTMYQNCFSCHTAEVNHYSGQCSDCHNTTDWSLVAFDHSLSRNCKNCHSPPSKHSSGACNECHSTNSWSDAKTNHDSYSVEECTACHQGDAPENHYCEDCCRCHEAGDDWSKTYYAHDLDRECTDCHTQDAPGNHYEGVCTNCHEIGSWVVVTFDHTNYTDCESCHTTSEEHYPGECTSCHDTGGWGTVSFDHTGSGDCQSCHAVPDGHNTGACTLCHSTNSWQEAVDHSEFVDCKVCHQRPDDHYPGQCADCHSTTIWEDATFTHTNLTDCASCHTAPAGHDDSQCSTCHNTSNWGEVSFSHDRVGDDCLSCHSPPSDDHYNNQCADCHSTDGWGTGDTSYAHDSSDNCSSCHIPPSGHWPGQCSDCHGTGGLEC